jgi:hypothetical protein
LENDMNRLLFALILATGCGSKNEACLDYADANKACIHAAEDAGLDVDVDFSDPEGFCDSFAETSDETWDCNAAAYNDADCTTNEGLAAALVAAEDCGPVK